MEVKLTVNSLSVEYEGCGSYQLSLTLQMDIADLKKLHQYLNSVDWDHWDLESLDW